MRSALVAAALGAAVSAQESSQTLWGQCGGSGWTGPTVCVKDAACTSVNEWYYQCTPGAAQATTTTRTTPPAISTTIKTSTTGSSAPQPSVSAPGTPTTAAAVGEDAPSPPSSIKVRLNPTSLANTVLEEVDYTLWTVKEAQTDSFAIGGVTFGLSVPSGNVLKGTRYKYVHTAYLPSRGERLVGAGISSEATGKNLAVTLTMKGLTAGTHTLQTFHNAWDNLASTGNLAITVDGKSVLTGVAQSVRKNNIWDAAHSHLRFSVTSTSQTVNIVFTPSGGDGRAFINGFEIDTAEINNQVSNPNPAHLDEYFDAGTATSVTVSWRAPKSASSPKYNIYTGPSLTSLKTVASGQSGTSVALTGLNTDDFVYWRVDVVSGSTTYYGRPFFFRLAHLAFPGAEGYGRFAIGGRQGKVVKVTSLADSTAVGTLRYALTVVTGPRTVVFDVGGVITLTSRLSVTGKYITIAGQTAPGKGIIIQGMPLGLSGAKDVILRHLRVRPGKVSGQTVDGMGMAGSNYCIMDRNSMGWAHDARIIKETLAGTTTYKGSASGKPGIIDDPKDVGGLESFPTTTRPTHWDANNDGIADWWDGSTGGAGYTPLEGYLNFMADPHVFVSPGKSVSIPLSRFAAGFTSSPTLTATVSGAKLGTVSVSGTTATYAAGNAAGIDYVTVVVKDSTGTSWTRTVGVAIYAGAS